MKNLTRFVLALSILCIATPTWAAPRKKKAPKKHALHAKKRKARHTTAQSNGPGAKVVEPKPVMRMEPLEMQGNPNAPEAVPGN